MRHPWLPVLAFTILSLVRLEAQSGPREYVLPASDRVFVVLADTPREVSSFEVYRRDPGDREYRLLTPQPITPTSDAHEAVRLIGTDFAWLARRVGTLDPEALWRKIRYDRGQAMAYSLVSHGLRLALGRTYVDTAVSPGLEYRYRVRLLDAAGRKVNQSTYKVKVTAPIQPEPPTGVDATARDGEVLLQWDYPAYKGRKDDRTVGFHLYRTEGGGAEIRVTPAPILRVEGFLSYLDREVTNGVEYAYALEAVDIIGVTSGRVKTPGVIPRDNRPPLIPGDLTALDDPDGVLLIWGMSPELDVSSYNIYTTSTLGDDEELILLNTEPVPGDSPRFMHRDVQRGTLHIYRVTAVDQSGNESPPSGPATITPRDSIPPVAVVDLVGVADPKTRQVILNWSPLGEADLLGYHVYRGPDPERLQRITPELLPEASFNDGGYEGRGQRAGAQMLYAVSGVDTSYNEGPLNVIEVLVPDTVPPEPPMGLTARSTQEGHVILRWRPSYVPDLTTARIYRKVNGDSDWQTIVSVNALKPEWTDSETQRGVTTLYRVTQLDGVGNESPPCPETVIIPTDVVPPDPPEVSEVLEARSGVIVRWEAVTANDLLGYRLYWRAYEGSSWRLVLDKVLETTEYLIRRGNPARSYGLSAVDTSGNESAVGPGKTAE